MSTARGIWDAAKHPRGARGRFGAKAVGVTPGGLGRDDRAQLALRGKRPLHNLPKAITGLYLSKRGKHTASVERFSPALYSHSPDNREEVILRERYRVGKRGPWQPHPRGGTYRPLLREAGWQQVGIRRKGAPKPSRADVEREVKSLRRRGLEQYAAKHGVKIRSLDTDSVVRQKIAAAVGR